MHSLLLLLSMLSFKPFNAQSGDSRFLHLCPWRDPSAGAALSRSPRERGGAGLAEVGRGLPPRAAMSMNN